MVLKPVHLDGELHVFSRRGEIRPVAEHPRLRLDANVANHGRGTDATGDDRRVEALVAPVPRSRARANRPGSDETARARTGLARLRDRAPKRATLGGGTSERSRRRLGPASRDAGRATDCAGVGASANASRRLNLPGDQLPQITQALHDVSNVHVVEVVDDWRHAAGGAIHSSMMAAVRNPGEAGTRHVRGDGGGALG